MVLVKNVRAGAATKRSTLADEEAALHSNGKPSSQANRVFSSGSQRCIALHASSSAERVQIRRVLVTQLGLDSKLPFEFRIVSHDQLPVPFVLSCFRVRSCGLGCARRQSGAQSLAFSFRAFVLSWPYRPNPNHSAISFFRPRHQSRTISDASMANTVPLPP